MENWLQKNQNVVLQWYRIRVPRIALWEMLCVAATFMKVRPAFPFHRGLAGELLKVHRKSIHSRQGATR